MKYKVGDKVRVIGNKDINHGFSMGEKGTIIEIDYDDTDIPYNVINSNGKSQWVSTEDIELDLIAYTREDLVRAYELGRQDEHQYIATGELNNELDREFPLPTE